METLELIKKAKAGDDNALTILFSDYKGLVQRVARKFYMAGAELEDLIQEGMIGLFKAINHYDHNVNDNFAKYAEICIEREIVSAIRKNNSLKGQILNLTEIKSMDDYAGEDYPEKDILNKESEEELNEKIFGGLSDFETQVVKLYLEGYKYLDIANKLNTSPKTIDNTLQNIKKKIKFKEKQ